MNKFTPEADRLYFTGSTAVAETELMAFDLALQKCGIHNANILEVSSVIPRDAELVTSMDPEVLNQLIDPGDFYPVVVSKETSSRDGEHIYAAVAGCMFESGYGVNVELHGSGKNREQVREEAEKMLGNMAERRDETVKGDILFEYNSMEVEGTCCVLSAVVYTRKQD